MAGQTLSPPWWHTRVRRWMAFCSWYIFLKCLQWADCWPHAWFLTLRGHSILQWTQKHSSIRKNKSFFWVLPLSKPFYWNFELCVLSILHPSRSMVSQTQTVPATLWLWTCPDWRVPLASTHFLCALLSSGLWLYGSLLCFKCQAALTDEQIDALVLRPGQDAASCKIMSAVWECEY